MARLIISRGNRSCPVVQIGVTNSDEVPVPQPPGTFPDNTENIPIYGLRDLMFTSVYDTNNDGMVDHAPWTGLVDPPEFFPSTIPLVQGLEERLQGIVAGTGVSATYVSGTCLDLSQPMSFNLNPPAVANGMRILSINGVSQAPNSYTINTAGTLLTVPVDLLWIGAQVILAYAY